MNMLATYLHHLDPVILEIPGTPLALRWYGLAYVGGFILGYLILLRLSHRKLYCVPPSQLGDFITWICILGVLLGGRLGEFFFYWLPEQGWMGLCQDPLWVLRVWEGGMASHGGIIAVLLVALFYARKYHLSLRGICDGLAIVCPIGLFFGRIANFINGELYGRVVDCSHPLAMKFPQEIYAFTRDQWSSAYVAVQQVCQENLLAAGNAPSRIIELCQTSEPVRQALAPFLTCRYPSQLFEALGEGLLIFIILITLRLTWKKAPAGMFAGLFCLLYSTARITTECFREPDADTWHGITRGQYLSFGVVLLGLAFLLPALHDLRQKKNSEN